MGTDQSVCMTLSLVMKGSFTITIRRRSVKVKFGLHEILHSRTKFVDNVLLAIFFMKFGFNTIMSLENGKTMVYRRMSFKCFETSEETADLIMHHYTNNGIFRSSTYQVDRSSSILTRLESLNFLTISKN